MKGGSAAPKAAARVPGGRDGMAGPPKLRHRCWLFSSGAMPTEVTSFSLEMGAHSKSVHIVTCSILRLWS